MKVASKIIKMFMRAKPENTGTGGRRYGSIDMPIHPPKRASYTPALKLIPGNLDEGGVPIRGTMMRKVSPWGRSKKLGGWYSRLKT